MSKYSVKTESKTTFYGLLALGLICLFTMGIVVGEMFSSSASPSSIDGMNAQIAELYDVTDSLNQSSVQYVIDGVSLSDLYLELKDSVVEITGVVSYQDFFYRGYSTVQGSGFVYEYSDEFYVITNYHVVSDASNLTVSFSNGNAYEAFLVGSDAYADLAVLFVDAPSSEFFPLSIVSSSSLQVGDPVVAIGSPLGLECTMTTGIVSQLGRTIEESLAGSFPIANIIQTSVAINPGNSGGPLLNYQGEVVGITTAIIEDTEGLGFAIPSDTIVKEIESLILYGRYDDHSWLGISGVDMSYSIADELDVESTYGWLITYVSENSAASLAGLQGGYYQQLVIDEYVILGGDIILAVDGYRVISGDFLMSYLESQTVPDQQIVLTILRDDEMLNIPIVLGSRSEVS